MNRSPHKFIVLEGIDGAGKTTVSQVLAKSINAKLYRTPPPGFQVTRRHIDTNARLNARFLFYLCSVVHTSDCIREALKRTHIVCDRYLISTLAYHQAFGLSLDWNLDQLGLVQPDFTFFLEMENEDERKRRMMARGKYTTTDAMLDDASTRKMLLDEYRKFPMQRIDTSSIGVEEVVGKIRGYIGI